MDQAELMRRFLQYTTELSVVCWDGSAAVLADFERQHSFLPQVQPLLQADALEELLAHLHDGRLYEARDLLGMELLLFRFAGRAFVMGPFATVAWEDGEAERTLAALGLPTSYLLPYKLYYGSHRLLDLNTAERMVTGAAAALDPQAPPYLRQTLAGLRGSGAREELFTAEPPDFEQAVRRYAQENRFLARIEAGDAAGALEMYERMARTSVNRAFSLTNTRAMVANATIVRTMARKAAERGGAHPAVVDAISVDYAQKMYACTDARRLYDLILAMLREFCDAAAAGRQQNYTPPVRRAVTCIALHLSQELTLPSLAKAARVSPAHLSRLFKEEIGLTVSRYIARARCEKAAGLLRTTDLPVQDISAHVGYLDNNYFAKVFRSLYGATPTAYRAAGRLPRRGADGAAKESK